MTMEPTTTLRQTFSIWSCVSIGWNTLNLFGGLSYIFVVGFSAGGFPAIFYGFLGSSIGALCIMLTFAECAASFSTAGGVYHYATFLTPERYRKVVSYPVGWFNYLGWVLTYAACCSILPGLVLSLVNLFDSSFDVTTRWQLFLLYLAWAIVAWLVNIIALKAISTLELIGCWVTLIAFFAFVITLLVVAPKATASSVFVDVVNETGYASNSMAVVLGLYNSVTAMVCLDAPTHLAEEIQSPKKVMPKVLVITLFAQFCVGVVWILVIGFSATNIDIIATTSTGVPIVELVRQATGSTAAAAVFNIVLLINYVAAAIGSATTASRQGYAFARDGGLFSVARLTRVSLKFDVPVWSVHLPFAIVVVLGIIYLFSTAGFTGILGAEVAFMILSYGTPSLVRLCTRRHVSLDAGRWSLGAFGYPVYIISVFYSLFVFVLVMIPQTQPVTAHNMNYTSLIFGACSILMVGAWFLQGKKIYEPPVNESAHETIDPIVGQPVSVIDSDLERHCLSDKKSSLSEKMTTRAHKGII